MSHSLCVMGVYDEVKMTVPMVVRYVHSDKKEKRNNSGLLQSLFGSFTRHPVSISSLPSHLYFSSTSFYPSPISSHLSSSLHLLLVYIGGSASTPSHIQSVTLR
jgi:hypothetical protein